MEKTYSPAATYFGPEKIWLISIDDTPYGYVPLDKGPDVFHKLLGDRKHQLEQDLGHSVSENPRQDDDGGYIVSLESPTRSWLGGGPRIRCKMTMKKIAVLTTIR